MPSLWKLGSCRRRESVCDPCKRDLVCFCSGCCQENQLPSNTAPFAAYSISFSPLQMCVWCCHHPRLPLACLVLTYVQLPAVWPRVMLPATLMMPHGMGPAECSSFYNRALMQDLSSRGMTL